MTFGVLWLLLTVWWVGLQCVIVVFPDHSHLLFSYSSKIQQKSVIGVIRWGWGGGGLSCNSKNIGYKTCGILTSTVWSVVAGHVMVASYT